MKQATRMRVMAAAYGPLLATIAYAIHGSVSRGLSLSLGDLFVFIMMSPLVALPAVLVFVPCALATNALARDLSTTWYWGLFSVLAGAGYVLMLMWADNVLGPNNFIIAKMRPEHVPAYATHFTACLVFTFAARAVQSTTTRG